MPYYGFYLAYASELLHLISPYYGDFIMRIAREGLVALGVARGLLLIIEFQESETKVLHPLQCYRTSLPVTSPYPILQKIVLTSV